MIDILAVHVAEIQGTLRAHHTENRTKPLVWGGEEILPGRWMLSRKRPASWNEHLTLHEVLGGLANKGTLATNADTTSTGVGA